MSFFSKLLHSNSKAGKSRTAETITREETKKSGNPKNPLSKAKAKAKLEREIALNKVNLCSLYNKNEEYKPVHANDGLHNVYETRIEKSIPKFKELIDESLVNLEALQKLAWQGVAPSQRPAVWKILLGYIPLNKGSRESGVARKREEYANFTQMYYYNMRPEDLDDVEKKAFKIVKDDVHRTQPEYKLFRHSALQEMMTKLLWIWHVRHPATGYVQGINDLTTPFIVAFMSEYIDLDFKTFEVPHNFEEKCPAEILAQVEADTYWCLSKILDGILDNYTFSHSGTQRALDSIKEITRKIDPELFKHLEKKGVDFKFFSFRWVFCLLVREFPLKVGLRLFDTYIADDQGFSVLHAYVCAALLLKWSVKIKKMNFTEIMLFLQTMPTKEWSEEDLEIIVAEAYVFKTLFERTYAYATAPSATSLKSVDF